MRSILILLTTAFALQAQASHQTDLQQTAENLESCLHRDNSNSGMKLCVHEAYVSADGVLNRVYQELLSALRAPSRDPEILRDRQTVRNRLVNAQRAWIPYRDAKCELDAIGSLGGSMESLERIDCYYRETSSRSYELMRLQELLP